MATNSNDNDDNYRSIWLDLQQASFRQGWVNAGGIRTRYAQAGRAGAPALMMLHGTAGSWEAFCRNLEAHAEHFDCYAIDMIGSGFSDKPDRDYEIPDYVEHAKNFMDAMNIGRASFIGVSLGRLDRRAFCRHASGAHRQDNAALGRRHVRQCRQYGPYSWWPHPGG